MAYANLKFCWHGVISTDPEAAKAFYTQVLDWTAVSVPMGDQETTMLMAKDGEPRAHLSAPELEGIPSHWDNYLRVEDVDATTQAANDHGGQTIVPPTDIPVGRFSMVTSPSGAVLALFREVDDSVVNPGGGHGSIHWTELSSTDVSADAQWLKGTFGFTTEDMPMPDGGTYHILKNGDAMCGGLMASQMPNMPSIWMSWVEVDDVVLTAARVDPAGGKLLGEIMHMPGTGRMVPVIDSTGGLFGIITPEAPQA